jgi:acyl-ACP thioesterase
MIEEPPSGRVFEAGRLARFGDMSPAGRLRLDAIGRYLQDVSGDDTADAGYDDLLPWVVRRLAVEVTAEASFREALTMRTWCSGTGRRWAERRVTIRGHRGARIEASVLWVHIDLESGAPRPLPDEFFALYGPPAADRRVSARLQHDPAVADGARCRPWALRFADFDPLRHVNNAVYLAMVEEALARRRDLRAPLRVEVEYRAGIDPQAQIEVAHVDLDDGSLALWVVDSASGDVSATATARALADD